MVELLRCSFRKYKSLVIIIISIINNFGLPLDKNVSMNNNDAVNDTVIKDIKSAEVK